MSITASEMTPADIAAVTNNGNGGGYGGFGGDGAWWLLVLLFAMNGGWFGGNRGGYGGQGAGSAGGDALYPWLNQSQQVNDGFRDQMLQTNVQGIQQSINALSTQLCNCCGDMQMALANGFAGVEQGANARQIANMNQAFGAQTAMMQGFNALGTQTAELRSTVISENCADREALNNIGRDIIAAQVAASQRQIDNQNMWGQKLLDAQRDQILFEERRENDRLSRQIEMQNLAASQLAQDSRIINGVYSRLSECPVDSRPVYGRTPIFTCPQQNNGCGCGCNNGFAN